VRNVSLAFATDEHGVADVLIRGGCGAGDRADSADGDVPAAFNQP
jgi:hypothetical protein